jgi:putative glutamine transport system permease protein
MIAGGDLMYTADSWSSANMYYGPAYVITGALYFIMCYPLAMISRKLELREKKKALVDIEDSITEQSVATEGGL